MANIGTQTTRFESGDNVHIAILPNTLKPAVVTGGGGGVSIYTK